MNELDLIAQLDQQQAALVNLAKILAGYYKQLMAEGLPEPLAGALLLDYQAFVLEQSVDDPGRFD